MTLDHDLRTAWNFLQAGNHKAATKICKSGMRRYPKEAGFYNFAGLAMTQTGKSGEASTQFAKALKLAPGNRSIQDNLVTALIQSGQYTRAASLLSQLFQKREDKGGLYYKLGLLEMNRGNHADALDAANNSVAFQTDAAKASSFNLRAVIHEAMGNDDEAYEDYKLALDLSPNNVEVLANIALQLSRRMMPDKALESLEKAINVNPQHLNALHRYGIMLKETGARGQAVQAFKKALAVDPANSDILRELALVEDTSNLADLKTRLEKTMQSGRKSKTDRARLAFALAHCFERIKGGDSKETAAAYRTANRLTAAIRPYDAAKAKQEEDAILRLFSTGQTVELAAETQNPVPIFIVGQPRSGTTLIEQILSAHADILGAGEQAIAGRLSHAFIENGGAYNAANATEFAQAYRNSMPGNETDRHGVIDKMPANYKYLGFLLSAFPNAIVFNITRDPRDVAWSMWRNWFPNAPMNYTFDMAAMAHEANAYARYIRHWSDLFPGRVNDIAYQDIVTDITGQSKRLASLCGVDWHPDMAAPEHNSAPVRTASALQVRQGVHSRSVGGWASHADALTPFIEWLDLNLWPDII